MPGLLLSYHRSPNVSIHFILLSACSLRIVFYYYFASRSNKGLVFELIV